MVNIRTSFTYLWMNVLMQCNAFFNNLILLNLYMGIFPKIHQQNPYRSLKSIYYSYVVLPNQDYVHSLTWEASKPITFSFSYKSITSKTAHVHSPSSPTKWYKYWLEFFVQTQVFLSVKLFSKTLISTFFKASLIINNGRSSTPA